MRTIFTKAFVTYTLNLPLQERTNLILPQLARIATPIPPCLKITQPYTSLTTPFSLSTISTRTAILLLHPHSPSCSFQTLRKAKLIPNCPNHPCITHTTICCTCH